MYLSLLLGWSYLGAAAEHTGYNSYAGITLYKMGAMRGRENKGGLVVSGGKYGKTGKRCTFSTQMKLPPAAGNMLN